MKWCCQKCMNVRQSWEPGIQKFECYWKLWKTYQPKHFQINSQTRRVHLQRYCWTLWNNKSFHIVQNNAPLINEKTSSRPRICGTTKNVCITTFNWNKRHAKLCYNFLQSGINLWWTYHKALRQNISTFSFSFLVNLSQE